MVNVLCLDNSKTPELDLFILIQKTIINVVPLTVATNRTRGNYHPPLLKLFIL